MASSSNNHSKKPVVNPFETLKENPKPKSFAKSIASDVASVGTGLFDQLFTPSGADKKGSEKAQVHNEVKAKTPMGQRKEFSVFNYNEYYERDLIKKEIRQLTEMIKKEIGAIKRANASMMSEVRDIENSTAQNLAEKPGIYHVRFLESVLQLLRNIKVKVSESTTWLSAMNTKKKKRGSLFAPQKKKANTAGMQSNEASASGSAG